MNRYPIYVNYENDTTPIGFVQLEDLISDDIIREGAIVPYLRKRSYDKDYIVINFGLIPRTMVDTRREDNQTIVDYMPNLIRIIKANCAVFVIILLIELLKLFGVLPA